ncbi:MAG: type I 3-dehydroquinate dehydratase [Fibrobacter sp.]|nr:type I 3-dehydroquinate dehydratase [Fibrobacter sp.]
MNSSEKYLVGLVGPEALEAAEKDPFHPVRLELDSCGALEIRYDFFDTALWPRLSERVRKIAPGKMQIGTIRLKHDGGTFDDARAVERPALWQSILNASEVPEWLDLERDYLGDFEQLNDKALRRKVGIIISEHNFTRIPGDQELEDFAKDVKRFKAPGLKIAAMSNTERDCDRLYKFIKKQSRNFKMFAAFGMGETGKISRVWSLKEGANLTYGAIGRAEAPGQIDVSTMKKALDQLDNFNSEFELLAFLSKF